MYLHRRRPEGAVHLSPSVVPESAKHLSGILEQKESCLGITAFFSRSRNKPRSRDKPGMTGRGASQHHSGLPSSVVPETRSAYPGSYSHPTRRPPLHRHPIQSTVIPAKAGNLSGTSVLLV